MASETKWSAGPWTTAAPERRGDQGKLYVRCARKLEGATAGIAVAHVLAAPGGAERDANAALVAAAPDLHAATRLALDVLHAGHDALEADCSDAVCRQLHAALARAEGR